MTKYYTIQCTSIYDKDAFIYLSNNHLSSFWTTNPNNVAKLTLEEAKRKLPQFKYNSPKIIEYNVALFTINIM